jgi:hypothetical protein
VPIWGRGYLPLCAPHPKVFRENRNVSQSAAAGKPTIENQTGGPIFAQYPARDADTVDKIVIRIESVVLGISDNSGFHMVAALVWLAIACSPAQAQPIRPETLLADLHREAQQQPAEDRLMLLWDLAIAATGMDPALSSDWSLEMYDLATNAPHELPWQQMNQVPERKNALTVLSLTDRERAAQHFLELERRANPQPNEDPRIDPRVTCSRGCGPNKAGSCCRQFCAWRTLPAGQANTPTSESATSCRAL